MFHTLNTFLHRINQLDDSARHEVRPRVGRPGLALLQLIDVRLQLIKEIDYPNLIAKPRFHKI